MKKIFLIVFSVLFFVFSAQLSKAASLYSGSAYQTVQEGKTFTVDWFLDTENDRINVIDFTLNFSSDTLQAIKAEPGDSLFSVWLKNPVVDNNKGSISLTAGLPNGASGKNISVFRTEFKAVKQGKAQIFIDPGSLAFRNDSSGSKIPLKLNPLEFTIAPAGVLSSAQITSPTQPDETKWYTNHDVTINFVPKNSEVYSYSFSSNLDIYPEDKEMKETSITYKDVPDGVYYFKLNSRVGPSAWQEAGIYKIQIDSTPPEEFKPVISSDPAIYEGKPFLSFATVDKTSGISHYKVNSGFFGQADNAAIPYEIKRQVLGSKITITAYDNAGNYRVETVYYPAYLGLRNDLIGAGVLLIIIALLAWRKRNKTKKIS